MDDNNLGIPYAMTYSFIYMGQGIFTSLTQNINLSVCSNRSTLVASKLIKNEKQILEQNNTMRLGKTEKTNCCSVIGGYASASSSPYSSPNVAFDGNNDTVWYPDQKNDIPQWIKFTFKSSVMLEEYSYTGSITNGTWLFEASNDDENFELIDKRTNMTTKDNKIIMCPIRMIKQYLIYRLTILFCTGSFNIAELGMYQSNFTYEPINTNEPTNYDQCEEIMNTSNEMYLLWDEKDQGIGGGNSAPNWTICDLTNITAYTSGNSNITLNNNKITFLPGIWSIEIESPCDSRAQTHQINLVCLTDNVVNKIGTSRTGFCCASLNHIIEVNTPKEFIINHFVSGSPIQNTGLGVPCNIPNSREIYTTVTIKRLK